MPAPPNVTTPRDIGTEIGNGRALDTGAVDVSTATQWSRVVPLDRERAVLAGDVDGNAFALTTKDGGRSFVAHTTRADGILTWSVGTDGTLVLSVARRQIPKKALPQGATPPIDTLTLFFAPPGEKLSSPAPLLAPDEKQTTPTIPRGSGMAAVLDRSLASFVVEIKPKIFAIAYGAGPGEALPTPVELPRDELPVNAPYGRSPQLLTIQKNKLIARPWPKPGELLAPPRVLDKVGVTKALVDELSSGPECEWGGWSFRRVAQPGNKTFLLGVSPDKWVFFELPSTVVNSSPIACSPDKVVVEAINPENLPALVTCTLDGVCVPPQNRPFLKPWPEQHERKLSIATTPKGAIAVQHLRTKTKWGLYASFSTDGGKLYDIEKRAGYGEGNVPDGYELGTLVGMGDRTLLLMSAKITKTTRRSWYALASDDGGLLWNPP